jgi:Ca2+-transporting ATPase
LNTSPGLTHAAAAAQLAADGPNALPEAGTRSIFAIVREVLREPMFMLLAAGAGIYVLVGDLHEAAVLAAAVLVVMSITVIQEQRSERALQALRDLSSPRALVLRDGIEVRIPGAQVVRGDLLILSEGDRVPADASLIEANDLQADESMLTGESLPIEKTAGETAYSGTLLVKGQGRAVVAATGKGTELGKIGASLSAIEPEKTRLEQEIRRVVRYAASIGLLASVAVTLLYVATRGGWLQGLLSGIALAMAALPEEFPLVLTVFLALGAWRLSREGVLARRMPVIETLGATTVLCVDKTGTLTENRMSLAQASSGEGWIVLGPDPVSDALQRLIEAAALASEQQAFDPMERAILEGAVRHAPQSESLRAGWQLEHDYPLSPDFPAVCHAWRTPDGEARVFIKGAPETVLALCRMDASKLAKAQAELAAAADQGMRVLAVAQAGWTAPGPTASAAADWPATPDAFDFRWLGYVALSDPLRAEARSAVAECRSAGIRVVMITGDHAGTAAAIAVRAGIAEQARVRVLTGARLDDMDDVALSAAARDTDVFARVRPEQKLRLVRAYRASGAVVAMTGDGVNDAPALRAAHIGVAMGKRGTDVAREAAGLVLVEDDFDSLVRAVRLGRRVYANLRNAMQYIIAVHVPTTGMALLPLAFGWPIFLYPVHIAFLEFVIDPACSIIFEAEPSDADAMLVPPRNPAERLFSLRMLLLSLLLGAALLGAVAALCAWSIHAGRADDETRALGFAAIVFGNLFLILASRSGDHSALDTIRRRNPAFWWVLGGTLTALTASLYFPPAATVFRFAPLGLTDLALALAAAACGVIWIEIPKWLSRRARLRRAVSLRV